MDERRKWKNVKTEEGSKRYKALNNQLRRATDTAREKWWTKQCDELKEYERSGKWTVQESIAVVSQKEEETRNEITGLQRLMNNINEVTKQFGMKINV